MNIKKLTHFDDNGEPSMVDIKNSLKLNKYISPEKIIVAESGLRTYEDLALLNENGIKNFLIGESLMKENELTSATKRILGITN